MQATVMEINLDNFLYNVNSIKKYVNNKVLIPVIKANAYGTYINERLDIINNFDIVSVARVSEGTRLRDIGYKKEILVLNQPCDIEIDEIIKNKLIVGICDYNFLCELTSRKEKVKVHIELETGMNRTGVKLEDLEMFIDKIKMSNNIIVEGVYTHLSSADFDYAYTMKQISKFKEGVELLKSYFSTIKYIHSRASNGLINYDDNISNAVRPGIILYGFEPFKGSNKIIDFKPVCALKTRIIFLKEINRRESVGYGRKYKSNKRMKIATIPIGYADGLRRSFAKRGYVVINNKKAKILGNICMDSIMVDVSNIDVKLNDEVYIWDNKNQSLDDVAKVCKTINYEIMSSISDRVKRVFYVKETK